MWLGTGSLSQRAARNGSAVQLGGGLLPPANGQVNAHSMAGPAMIAELASPRQVAAAQPGCGSGRAAPI